MCSEEQLPEPWGRLVSQSDDGEEVPVLGESFTIGRGNASDFEISDNKYISSLHCELSRDAEGRGYLKDLSSNGTLLNGARIGRNNQVRVRTGDVIAVVFRKDNPKFNVEFKFEELPNNPTVDGCEGTLDYEISEGTEEEEEESKTGAKRPAAEEWGEGLPPAKRPAIEYNSPETTNPPPPPLLPRPELQKADSIEETLVCQICYEMLHDCVSLQPCMHSYCGGCYSDWMAHSNTCPACRVKVERINKNHIVNNLVAAYVRANPDKKRAEEDIKELDAKNKISADMLYPKGKKRYHSDSDEESGSDTDMSDEDSPGYPALSPLLPPFPAALALFHAPLFPLRAPTSVCCQCPNYLGPAPPKAPPPHLCTPHSNHVLCMCCLRPMPDRRNEPNSPAQKCDVCGKAFCHMYWGCSKPGCHGCLNAFKDMDFSGDCFNGVLNDNAYESRVLRQWLVEQGKSVADMLEECCARLQAGQYQAPFYQTLSPDTHTCFSCALQSFKQLAYCYRRDIPNSQLPAEVTARPDCHWGRNCRTQANKPHHAQNFNHICEQTKF